MDETCKLALIRLVGTDRFDSNTCDKNVGLGYLASAAQEAGIPTAVFDPIDITSESLDRYASFFADFQVVGFSIHALNIENSLQFVGEIKERSSETLTIFGGHHAGATAYELLSDFKTIDVVCVGHGEQSLVEICQSPKKFLRSKGGDGQVVTSRIDGLLDHLPSPLRPTIGEIERISTSRGCPFSCTFCTTPAMIKLTGESPYSVRSVTSVLAELKYLSDAGVRHVYINDDLFVVGNRHSKKRAEEIADRILAEDLPITFKTQLRADSYSHHDADQLSKLRRAGMTEVFLGLESGSTSTLNEYGKECSVEQNIRAVEMYTDLGIKVNAGNIPASPNSKTDDLLATVDMFSRLNLAFLLFRRVTFRALVFPGTQLEKSLVADNRLIQDKRYFLGNYDFIDPALAEIIDALEEYVPGYLDIVGSSLFRFRNELARQSTRLSSASQRKFESLMEDWSQAAEETFREVVDCVSRNRTEDKLQDKLLQYTEYSQRLEKRLERIPLDSNQTTMAGDLF